jgi:hypothetical protein
MPNPKLNIIAAASEYLNLRTALESLSSEANDWNDIQDRMTFLTKEMVKASAATPRELVAKAMLTVEWLDADTGDLSDKIALSLCRDVLAMFRARGPSATHSFE